MAADLAATDRGPSAWALASSERGETVCTIDDPRARELSGLVAVDSGYIVINDSQLEADQMHIVQLDAGCRVVDVIDYPTPARDPEDLAVGPDGALWVADIGDNINSDTRRETVALWRVDLRGSRTPVLYRLSYLDDPHDAEALIFTSDGLPLIITKEIDGQAGLYLPRQPLDPDTVVVLQRVGEFVPRATGTPNRFGTLGEVLITGAAVSPDWRRVVLRTYTAAYEWDIPDDGDVVKAITTQLPRVTPLPDEPQGEAIAYTVDGRSFLTVSDEEGPTELRRYTPSTTTLPPLYSPPPTPKQPPTAVTKLASVPPWYGLAAGAAGLIIAAVGYLGLRRGRAGRSGQGVAESDAAEGGSVASG